MSIDRSITYHIAIGDLLAASGEYPDFATGWHTADEHLDFAHRYRPDGTPYCSPSFADWTYHDFPHRPAGPRVMRCDLCEERSS